MKTTNYPVYRFHSTALWIRKQSSSTDIARIKRAKCIRMAVLIIGSATLAKWSLVTPWKNPLYYSKGYHGKNKGTV